ncbi:nitric oxide associated protein 1 [Entomortierella beljakovae]|nr:nitric oxide associated protein 1 [Entomortierella beljakovae]
MNRSLNIIRNIHPHCRSFNATRPLSTFLSLRTSRTKPRNLPPHICSSYQYTKPNSTIPCSVSYRRILSSQFSTDVGQTPPSEATLNSNAEAKLKEKMRRLIGVPCPGCGSQFQIKDSKSPGYLPRESVDPSVNDHAVPKEPPKPIFDPTGSSMSNGEYQKYLKTLDPKILQEMGLQNMIQSIDESVEEKEGGEKDSAKIEEDVDKVLEKKPKMTTKGPARIICKRCHSLAHHHSPLANLEAPTTDYFPASIPKPAPEHIRMLRESKNSTVVLVMDLVDFPLSIPQPIIDELLSPSPKHKDNPYQPPGIVVVGNKFDLMPQGTKKHTVVKNIREYFEKNNLDQKLRAIHVVSARHPNGDEIAQLIKSIAATWIKFGKRHVVMVGSENVGKSQLLNAILWESTRWKTSGSEIERKNSGLKKLERKAKLNAILAGSLTDGSAKDEEWDAMTGTSSEGDDLAKYKELYVDQGLEKVNMYKTTVSNVPGTTLQRVKVPLRVLKKYLGSDYKDYDKSFLVDTPGIRDVNGQLTSWLTVQELSVSTPKNMLKPSSFILDEGRSFFLGGLVRIDCLSVGRGSSPEKILEGDDRRERETRMAPSGRVRGSNPLPKLTVFTELPLHITSTERADAFLEMTSKGELTILQPPFGSSERIEAFPGLSPALGGDLEIVNDPLSTKPSTRILDGKALALDLDSMNTSQETRDPFTKLDSRFDSGLIKYLHPSVRRNAQAQIFGQHGICDIVFSGIGWVMVSGKFHGENQAVKLRVWTPKGQGAIVREPSFFPEFASQPVEKTSGGIRQNRKIFSRLPNSIRPKDKKAILKP